MMYCDWGFCKEKAIMLMAERIDSGDEDDPTIPDLALCHNHYNMIVRVDYVFEEIK